MSDPLVDIIEKALYGYVKPFQAVHVARKVVRVIAAPEHREAVLRELREKHGDDLGGALRMAGLTDEERLAVDQWCAGEQVEYEARLRRGLERVADEPMAAPSIQEPEHG